MKAIKLLTAAVMIFGGCTQQVFATQLNERAQFVHGMHKHMLFFRRPGLYKIYYRDTIEPKDVAAWSSNYGPSFLEAHNREYPARVRAGFICDIRKKSSKISLAIGPPLKIESQELSKLNDWQILALGTVDIPVPGNYEINTRSLHSAVSESTLIFTGPKWTYLFPRKIYRAKCGIRKGQRLTGKNLAFISLSEKEGAKFSIPHNFVEENVRVWKGVASRNIPAGKYLQYKDFV